MKSEHEVINPPIEINRAVPVIDSGKQNNVASKRDARVAGGENDDYLEISAYIQRTVTLGREWDRMKAESIRVRGVVRFKRLRA